jgi:ribonuclease HI
VTLIAAADGSALGNPGPAGWAWYIDPERWACGGWTHGTNNMGELTAVLDLLRQTAGVDDELLVYCDSMYVINSLTALAGRRVTFEWVKGHSGHPLNEEADRLANAAAVAFSQGLTPDAGPGLGKVVEAVPAKATAVMAPDEPEDLFSAMADQLEPEPSDIDRVIALERSLLTDEVRADPAAVAALLHPDWCEIGQSGRLWTRSEILTEIAPLPADVDLEVIAADQVDARTILLVWRSASDQGSALRSSLWVRGHDWRQRFHQGTAEP